MVTTVFDLQDCSGNKLFTHLNITPNISGINYSGSIVSSNTITVIDNQNASVSIGLVPNSYDVRLTGFQANTRFNIDISSVEDGNTVNASQYLI